VCSALLVGPTGVGKTELSKVVARELFDDEKHIVRIDMRSHLFFFLRERKRARKEPVRASESVRARGGGEERDKEGALADWCVGDG
jgi:DNA polymerase III delta prime subunit